MANLAGIEQPSMAQLLARMERDGLIRHQTGPGGQAKQPHLTDGGCTGPAAARTLDLAARQHGGA